MTVQVVCDSTSYTPQYILDEFGVKTVSLFVNWSDKSRRESDITDLDEFYTGLREMRDLPTTSQPSVGNFLEVYRPIIDAGDEIVSVHFSSGISGTFQSACQAKNQLERDGVDPSRITVIDSGSACGGYAMVLLAAASRARAGASHEVVVASVQAMIAGHSFWFAVDTLEYLRRGGRIGVVASWVGTAIKIKPILTVGSEGILPVERVRTQSRVIARLYELAEEAMPHNGGFVVQHVQAPERAEQVTSDCRERFGTEPLFVSEIGPVIGAHVGPGLIGVGVYPAGLIDPLRSSQAATFAQ